MFQRKSGRAIFIVVLQNAFQFFLNTDKIPVKQISDSDREIFIRPFRPFIRALRSHNIKIHSHKHPVAQKSACIASLRQRDILFRTYPALLFPA
jgi:hypothetical protein